MMEKRWNGDFLPFKEPSESPSRRLCLLLSGQEVVTRLNRQLQGGVGNAAFSPGSSGPGEMEKLWSQGRRGHKYLRHTSSFYPTRCCRLNPGAYLKSMG